MAVLNIVGVVTIAAAGAVNVASSVKSIVGAVTIVAGGVTAGAVGSPKAIAGAITLSGGGAVNGTKAPQIKGVVTVQSGGTAAIGASHAIRGKVAITGSGSVTGSVAGQGLLVNDAVKAVTELWSVGCCGVELEDCICNTIMVQINAALQMIFSRASSLDYFNRTELTVEVLAAASSVILSQGIQGLHGPVRREDTKMPLSACSGMDELDNFVDYYYAGAAPEEPRAYYLDSKNQSQSDSVALTLHVTPAPSVNTNLKVDAILEPPRYTCEDSRLGTPLHLPHKYAEILLFPIIRKWATAHRMFTRREMQPQIDEQFAIAQSTLGLIQPDTKETQKAKKP